MGCCGYCSKCTGVKKALTGALVLANAFWWPKWTGLDGWVTFFGALLLLGGILRALKPTCGCPEATCEMPKKKK